MWAVEKKKGTLVRKKKKSNDWWTYIRLHEHMIIHTPKKRFLNDNTKWNDLIYHITR